MTFTGVIPAVMTAFDDDLQIATEHLADNARALQEAGIEHVVVCGTMGEAAGLSHDERAVVIETVLGTGLTVTVGISAATTAQAVANARQAAELGAHGVMCLPPTTYEATERELDAFYERVTGATELPMMIYNNTEAAKNDLQPRTIVGLAAAHERIVAVKECSGDARRIAHILELAGDRLDVLVGGDDWALEGYAAGAVGWVSGVANVAAKECLELERAALAGELDKARAIYPRLLPLARLDMDPRLVQSFKAALDLTGRYGGPVRPPRLPLSEPGMNRVREAVGALQRVAV